MGSTIACCFGTGFCSFCCSACPSCKGSTSTRLAYSVLLFVCLITFCTMRSTAVEQSLMNMPHLCENSTATYSIRGNCTDYIAGSRAVYRLSFGATIFSGLLSILVSEFVLLRIEWMKLGDCLDDTSEHIK